MRQRRQDSPHPPECGLLAHASPAASLSLPSRQSLAVRWAVVPAVIIGQREDERSAFTAGRGADPRGPGADITTSPAADAAWGRRAARRPAARVHRPAAANTRKPAPAPDPWAGATRQEIAPASAILDGPRAVQHVVVSATLKDGTTTDATDRVTLTVGNPHLAKVAGGVVTPLADGETQQLIHDNTSDSDVINELYLATLSRRPTAREGSDALTSTPADGCEGGGRCSRSARTDRVPRPGFRP